MEWPGRENLGAEVRASRGGHQMGKLRKQRDRGEVRKTPHCVDGDWGVVCAD